MRRPHRPQGDDPVPRRDNGAAPGKGSRQSQGEFVGLGTGVHKVNDRKRVGHGRRQALSVIENGAVQVACVGIECLCLPGDGLDNVGVAVSDMTDVVDAIEVGSTAGIVEPRTPAAYDV